MGSIFCRNLSLATPSVGGTHRLQQAAGAPSLRPGRGCLLRAGRKSGELGVAVAKPAPCPRLPKRTDNKTSEPLQSRSVADRVVHWQSQDEEEQVGHPDSWILNYEHIQQRSAKI